MTSKNNQLIIFKNIKINHYKYFHLYQIQSFQIFQNLFNCLNLFQFISSPIFYHLILTNHFICFSAVTNPITQDHLIYSCLPLNYQLKLQLIHFQQNNIKSPITAFRLKNQILGIYLQISSSNLETVNTCVNLLTNKINRIGFKEYFKPIQRIGKGGCGVVYEVQSLIDGKRYAAKAFSKEHLLKDYRTMKGLINEIKIMRKLQHKNVMKLYGVYQSQNSIYFLLQLLKGGNLLERLDKKDVRNKIDCQNIKSIMYDTLDALNYLHSLGIIHRDIKLQNIMLRNQKNFQPVIIDFGFSVQQPTISNAPPITLLQDVDHFKFKQTLIFSHCGTPGYLAPEIFQQTKILTDITSKSDIYSMGIIFYMISTKKPLYNGCDWKQVLKKNRQNEYQIQQNFPSANQPGYRLLLKMLQKQPQQRISAQSALKDPYFHNHYLSIEHILLKQHDNLQFNQNQLQLNK